MLTYRLPLFIDYLHHDYRRLYEHYIGRLIELFPSFQSNENNLMIVHDAGDTVADDELVIRLWKEFSETTSS